MAEDLPQTLQAMEILETNPPSTVPVFSNCQRKAATREGTDRPL